MGGRSSSGDVVTHPASGVLIYEDAAAFSVMWSKEFYRNNYVGQNVRVQQIVLNLGLNTLYVALNPVVILKMIPDTGVILLQRLLYFSTSYHSEMSQIVTMLYSPMMSLLCFQISDQLSRDHYFHVDAGDLSSRRNA